MNSSNLIHPIHLLTVTSTNSSFQGIRFHDLTHVIINAWLEANLHKILKWSLSCNLYQNLSKTGNDKKKSVGLLFLSHDKLYTFVTWPVMVKFRKEEKIHKD